MKQIERMLSFGWVLLALFATSTYAESPREQLNQMVQQLQKTPNDKALREQSIKLAQGLKSAPAIPEDARKHLARGAAAFSLAKSSQGYQPAIDEFQQAANSAPWWPDPYYNLAQTMEQSGDANGAVTNYQYYLLAAPNAPDAEKVRTELYKVQYLAEQKQKEADAHVQQAAQQQAAQKAAQEQGAAWTKSLNGAKWRRDWHLEAFGKVGEGHDVIVCSGSIFVATTHMTRDDMPDQMPAGSSGVLWTATLKSGERAFNAVFPNSGGHVWGHGVISEDGQTITVTSDQTPIVYTRE